MNKVVATLLTEPSITKFLHYWSWLGGRFTEPWEIISKEARTLGEREISDYLIQGSRSKMLDLVRFCPLISEAKLDRRRRFWAEDYPVLKQNLEGNQYYRFDDAILEQAYQFEPENKIKAMKVLVHQKDFGIVPLNEGVNVQPVIGFQLGAGFSISITEKVEQLLVKLMIEQGEQMPSGDKLNRILVIVFNDGFEKTNDFMMALRKPKIKEIASKTFRRIIVENGSNSFFEEPGKFTVVY